MKPANSDGSAEYGPLPLRGNGRNPKTVPQDGGKFKFLTIAELKQMPVTPWRVVKVLPGRGLIVLWGAPGSGKTFALIDVLFAIARGRKWHGRRTVQGLVVLVAAEGSMRGRLTAYQEHTGCTDEELAKLRVVESRINLLDPTADLPDLLADLEALQKRSGPIAVVAIDTLNRAMPGGNENAPEDMSTMVDAAKAIEAGFGCAVVYVHHCGKDESRGARGHNSLKGAADAELSVRKIGEGKECRRELVSEKLRDAEDGELILAFRLLAVDLGPLRDIDPHAEISERWTSCVVDPLERTVQPAAQLPKQRRLTGVPKLAMDAITAAINLHGRHPAPLDFRKPIKGVTLDQGRAEFNRIAGHIDSKYRASRFAGAVTSLKASGHVAGQDDWLWLPGTGCTALPGALAAPNHRVSKETLGDFGANAECTERTEQHRIGDFGDFGGGGAPQIRRDSSEKLD